MTVLLLTHPDCLDHDPGHGHPESPARLAAVLEALRAPEFAGLVWQEAPLAGRAALARVHPAHYLDRILPFEGATEQMFLDADTVIGPGSVRAALRAAGGCVAGVDAVMAGRARAAFVAVRPPGHHAEPDRAMGFCLFSNAAIAALHARWHWGLHRIAVVDFDVHHGNGTQAVFEHDPELFYGSTHQHPCFPGTGMAGERGSAGNVVNVPLPPGSGPVMFRAAWERRILPALAEFEPEFLVVSAGFDAHRDDPLAELTLIEPDFAWLTAQLVAFTGACCGGRLVSVLEGGYDIPALGRSAAAHVLELLRDG